jgi:hypothetical protein
MLKPEMIEGISKVCGQLDLHKMTRDDIGLSSRIEETRHAIKSISKDDEFSDQFLRMCQRLIYRGGENI